MNRVKLGEISQRNFLDLCISKLDCVSLRGLLDYGFGIKYDALKSYYSGRRLLPYDFFENLCILCNISLSQIPLEIINSNWGQVVGGKKGIRKN